MVLVGWKDEGKNRERNWILSFAISHMKDKLRFIFNLIGLGIRVVKKFLGRWENWGGLRS